MTIPPSSSRLLLAACACALAFPLVACTDNSPGGVAPPSIPPSSSTGPGNAFAPGDPAADTGPGRGADTGFPSNGGGDGVNAPGH